MSKVQVEANSRHTFLPHLIHDETYPPQRLCILSLGGLYGALQIWFYVMLCWHTCKCCKIANCPGLHTSRVVWSTHQLDWVIVSSDMSEEDHCGTQTIWLCYFASVLCCRIQPVDCTFICLMKPSEFGGHCKVWCLDKSQLRVCMAAGQSWPQKQKSSLLATVYWGRRWLFQTRD